MKLEVGEAYKDGNGSIVAIVAQHPWRPEVMIGALADGTIRLYEAETGMPHHPYGNGQIVKKAVEVLDVRRGSRKTPN